MESATDIALFRVLRQEVAACFMQTYHTSSKEVKSWKGQDIVAFQEDLQAKVDTSISEKWFYTYFKKDAIEKLPRIDMLNLLSQYASYQNWQHFVECNSNKVSSIVQNESIGDEKKKKNYYWLFMSLIIIALASFVFILSPSKKNYTLCFIDKDLQKSVEIPVEVLILNANEAPYYLNTDENACVQFESSLKEVIFTISSPYYLPDTFVRKFDKNKASFTLPLVADEYALILHYFSNTAIEDWKTRRIELGKMIADNAKIYQVFGSQEFGIDVYTKEAFINKISLPTSSLKNMNILELLKEEGQIIKLKFEIKTGYE